MEQAWSGVWQLLACQLGTPLLVNRNVQPVFPQPATFAGQQEEGERQGVFEHAWSVAATLANYCCGCVQCDSMVGHASISICTRCEQQCPQTVRVPGRPGVVLV